MKKIVLLFLLCFFVSTVNTFAQSKVEWNRLVFLDNQIYPSFLLATANMKENFGANPWYDSRADPFYFGSTNSPVGIIITSPKKKTKINLSIKIAGFAEPTTYSVELPEKDKVYMVFPPVIWNWDKLRNLRQPTPVNITYDLTVNGKAENTQNVVGTVRSVNEALLGYNKPISKSWVDTTFVLTAYVNEDHPWIDQLLKEALDAGLVDSFDGYQSKDATRVLTQVAAIWNVLQRRGFKSSSITETSNASKTVFTQTVRLFEDSINASQANCVDGTALIAAILTKIGIEATMVTMPGHCFLAFRIAQGEPYLYLETTMMGGVNMRGMNSAQANKASSDSFINAIKSAGKTFADNKPGFDTILTDSPKPGYSFMNLSHARKLFGISPIAR